MDTSGTDGTPAPAGTAHDLALLAQGAARAVAPYLRRVAHTVTVVETKADVHDPVTEHDRRVESALHTLLARMVPGSRVLGEETGEHVLPEDPGRIPPDFADHFALPTAPEVRGALQRSSELGDRVRWILDPIDGTANFAAGLPWFNTSVAAELDGQVVAGSISVPLAREVFTADSEHCWHQDPDGTHELRAEGPAREQDAVLLSYHPGLGWLTREPHLSLDHEARLARAYQAVRRPGAGALDLAMVAAGWAGAMLGVSFKPWDVAAGIHMVRVAGGQVLNLPGTTSLPDGLRPIVVASARSLDAPTARSVAREVQQLLDAGRQAAQA